MKNINSIKKKIHIVAGFPRSGTTFLYHNLQKHPSVYVPYRKELAFFAYYHSKGYQWYLNHFKDMKTNQIGFDISSLYLLSRDTIRKIKKFNSSVKMIVSVRDPVEFALSMYAQVNSYSSKPPAFKDFIEEYCFKRINKNHVFQLSNNYIPDTVDMIQNLFGDNLLIYDFTAFTKNPLIILKSIESFVGIKPYFNSHSFDSMKINSSNRKSIKLISTLLVTGDLFPRILRHIFPDNIIRSVRTITNKFSSNKQSSEKYLHTPSHIQLAQEVFADQRNFYLELFKNHEIQLGSGDPFKY